MLRDTLSWGDECILPHSEMIVHEKIFLETKNKNTSPSFCEKECEI